MNVGAAIVNYLEAVDVDTIFGGAGTSKAAILLEFKKSKRIKTIMVKNEQGAAFMACGYAMFSDKLGVCFASAGPGEFNLFGGLAVALSDSLPVLSLGGFVAKELRGKGTLNEATGLKRTPDARTMFACTTKGEFFIEEPEQACDVLEEAINLALEGRPGPVHVHFANDVLTKEVPNFREFRLKVKPVLSASEELSQFAEALTQALRTKEPLMAVIGYGAVRSHAENELLHFIERFQIPFATTMDAKGILPENHPLSLGGVGTSGERGAKRYLDQAKVVLALGNSFAQHATFLYKPNLLANKILMQINIDPAERDKVYKADYFLTSDLKPAIAAITSELSGKLGVVEQKHLARDKHYDQPIESKGNLIHPALLVKEISKNLPANSIIMGDAGAHMLWLNAYLELDQGQIYQNPGNFGSMAASVNGSIGVKCANPDRHVVVGTGDGSYLMSGFELMTAVEHQIPVVWIIFNNGGFNIIRHAMQDRFGEYTLTDFPNPDYVAYAQACGAKGYRVEKLEDFAGAFRAALQLNAPCLIDVVIDPDVYPPLVMQEE